MQSLASTFTSLKQLLLDPDRLNPTRGDPFFYFVHAPEQTPLVKQSLNTWCAALRQEGGWKVEVVSLADLLWQEVDAGGYWNLWLENEPACEPAEVRRSVQSFLIEKNRLVERIKALVTQDEPGRLLLLTDAAVLHPFFRVRAIEDNLHNMVRTPTVLFYPGRRVGQFGLSFLDLYEEDGNYRSTLVGG